jgi:hypothetical protein
MARLSYPKALDEALRPHGFARDRDNWVRIRGDMWECVNRQSGWLGGVTVNLFKKDLETEKLYIEIFGPDAPRAGVGIDERVGGLIDGYDRWWTKDEPDGPQEMARAVVTHGLPWFDRVQTLEDQAANWYGQDDIQANEARYGQTNLLLALTLWRMGWYEDVDRLARRAPRKTSHPWEIESMARLREWLEGQPRP